MAESRACLLRAPFARYEGVSGPAELDETPRNTIGELIKATD
ncbi:hypothetical protein [Nonomuraea guangzhouensis]|uniref:Uncharacterized protein n=1 Tax=Nonomuraea guangzhouensis TaxID=1291555 RepID=A0ABW4G1G0_9ACTN|nr:hypothetical protein [Nonomuraea guangzhouensis]